MESFHIFKTHIQTIPIYINFVYRLNLTRHYKTIKQIKTLVTFYTNFISIKKHYSCGCDTIVQKKININNYIISVTLNI